MNRPPIIALARIPWVGTWMNRQQLLSRLASRGWPVVYSNGALSIWDRYSGDWARAPWLGRFERRDGIVLDRPGRWFPRWQRWPAWDRMVLRRHARRLRRAAKLPTGGDGIAFLFEPGDWPYVEHLNCRHVVYHVYDIHALVGDWPTVSGDMEGRLVARADLLTAASKAMARALPGDGAGKARILHNGADADFFIAAANSVCPTDLAAVPHPRIGYSGAINRKVDLLHHPIHKPSRQINCIQLTKRPIHPHKRRPKPFLQPN